MIIQRERPVGAQRFFEIGKREAGIDGEKRARRVDRFEHQVRTAAAAHAIAENAQQIAGLGGFAHLDVHDLVQARKFFDLARLRRYSAAAASDIRWAPANRRRAWRNIH